MWIKLKALSSILSHLLIGIALVDANLRCYDTGNFTLNSTYGKNRDLILASLLPNVSANGGFSTASIGQNSNKICALGMCRGDSTPNGCYTCLNSSIQDLIASCPNRKKPFHGELILLVLHAMQIAPFLEPWSYNPLMQAIIRPTSLPI
ncbi:hypothetical protein V6Z11_A06G139900 [Gossypium hirsutum]|uniref:Cysteine-rich receptor-like protein kinase 14 n=1 Tax=Gossypium hirsutum TaxID=3635 RepID=A0A1U8PXL0_GOSHI|nr:cysteine-rich receptor-like protein kinase 14 [Gossypium hirsutum]